MQISIGEKLGEFLLGLLGSSVLVVTWWWGVRRLIKPAMARRLYRQPPLDRLMPLLLLVLCCVGASLFWTSRRWTSYGLLMPVALAFLTALFLMWRAQPKQSR
jgi:hypothetical protein